MGYGALESVLEAYFGLQLNSIIILLSRMARLVKLLLSNTVSNIQLIIFLLTSI